MNAALQFAKQKNIKSFLVLLFLTKPTIDLFWNYTVEFAGFNVGPLHITGIFVFFYLSYLLIVIPNNNAPCFKLLIIFVALNFISAVFGFTMHDEFEIQGILNLFFRVMDSVVIYGAAFALALRNEEKDWTQIVTSIAIGVGIALILNHIAIAAGYGGGMKVGAASMHSSLRERGLYYDPGALAIVALYGFIFISYTIKSIKLGLFKLSFCVISLLSSVYLMVSGLSRSVFILLAFYIVSFFVVFGKTKEKAFYILAIAAVIVVAATYSLVNYERLTARFDGDIGAVENITEDVSTGKGVSTKDLAALGSNRGRNWIISLEWIFQRGPIELMFGNFKSTPAHSDYIDILSRNGILGLTLYIFILFSFLTTTFKALSTSNKDDYYYLHVLSFVLIAIYILYSIPFRPLNYTTTAWYMWTALGFSMAQVRLARRKRRLKVRQSMTQFNDVSSNTIQSGSTEPNSARKNGGPHAKPPTSPRPFSPR